MFKRIFLTFLTVGLFNLASGQTTSDGLKEESNIYQKIFDSPLSLVGENQMAFHELYSGKPLLLALIFTRCTGICTPFLIQLKENLQFKTDSFNVLVLSFDPHDQLEDMELLAERLELNSNKNWYFGIADSISQLNNSINFFPVWDSTKNQFDHDALLVGINNQGFITKKLIGIRQGHDLDLMVASISNIFSPTYRLPTKNNLFSCFNYDPATGKNTPGLGLLFIALPAVVAFLLLISISHFVRKKPNEIEA